MWPCARANLRFVNNHTHIHTQSYDFFPILPHFSIIINYQNGRWKRYLVFLLYSIRRKQSIKIISLACDAMFLGYVPFYCYQSMAKWKCADFITNKKKTALNNSFHSKVWIILLMYKWGSMDNVSTVRWNTGSHTITN